VLEDSNVLRRVAIALQVFGRAPAWMPKRQGRVRFYCCEASASFERVPTEKDVGHDDASGIGHGLPQSGCGAGEGVGHSSNAASINFAGCISKGNEKSSAEEFRLDADLDPDEPGAAREEGEGSDIGDVYDALDTKLVGTIRKVSNTGDSELGRCARWFDFCDEPSDDGSSEDNTFSETSVAQDQSVAITKGVDYTIAVAAQEIAKREGWVKLPAVPNFAAVVEAEAVDSSDVFYVFGRKGKIRKQGSHVRSRREKETEKETQNVEKVEHKNLGQASAGGYSHSSFFAEVGCNVADYARPRFKSFNKFASVHKEGVDRCAVLTLVERKAETQGDSVDAHALQGSSPQFFSEEKQVSLGIAYRLQTSTQ